MRLVVEAPLNSLSFGNVSYNILRELWRKGVDVMLYPVGGKMDLNAYDKIDKEFLQWLQSSAVSANEKIKKDDVGLKLWHLNGSNSRISKTQGLFTFHELDRLTPAEVSLANLQDKLFVSSSYTQALFKSQGVDSTFIPCGFDEDFHKTNKQYLSEEVVHFGLMGKLEKRKHTAAIINLWLRKYGNNPKYQLTACVTNPFMKKEEQEAIIKQCTGGHRFTNINFLPYLKTNSEVNDLLNAIDVDLTGLSGAEGWNLPAFNATCLGKWSLVHNVTAHRDWATNTNSILIEPCAKTPAWDGKFFAEGQPFNQGNIYIWDEEVVAEAMDIAAQKKNEVNKEGLALQEQFSWKNSVEKILQELDI